MPLPPNFCFVNSYELKSMSFKVGKDFFNTFEMPRVSYTMILQKSYFISIYLKILANSQPSASNFKSFSRSLEQFFLTVGQNNFGNKIPLPKKTCVENKSLTFLLNLRIADPCSDSIEGL